jgi:arylsulfatase A-like enzyme
MSTLLPTLTLALVGCGSDRRPPGVGGADASEVVLSALPFAELVVPADSRDGREPPSDIPLRGTWRYTGETRQGMHKWATDIPIRPRGLFFHRPQPGMELRKSGKALRYDRFGKSKAPMWIHDRREIVVYTPEKGREPVPGTFVLSYPKATERERALNRAWSGQDDPAAFAWTSIQDDWDNRRGLLLPAPGTAAWDLTVPASAELRFAAGLVEPEVRDGPGSDGATLVVEVDADGRTEEVYSGPLDVGAFVDRRLDLSRWSGRAVRLRLRTEPGATSTFDYAFVAEPIVASNRADPVRVVMVFVDTLRPDHLSMYGYGRDTSAALDPLAASATVFTQARSVAPWTLPSARTIVTGRQPEYFFEAASLPALLGERGWATAFFAGNVYLSNNFQMTRDWDFHRVGLWPKAEETTDDALAWLDAHEGRNALLQVHYMSPHLPYVEPEEYRRRYAGATPDGLREQFYLSDVKKAKIESDPDAQQYVRDRYDNNVRYATDQVRRIVDRLDDNDVLLFFSDHGEEFWDHQGFEHGHSLYDELLRVPLVVKAPGVQPGTVDAPVSLLDVAPTVLDLVGVPVPEEMEGRSLGPLLRREPGAAEAFAERDQAFGRQLYGLERWGVLHESKKWTTTEGREQLFDLDVDAGEKKNLLKELDLDTSAYRGALGDALGRKVMSGYRLVPSAHRGDDKDVPGLWAMCTVPGGFSAAWKADDPLENSDASVQTISDPAVLRAQLDRFGFADHPVTDGDGGVEVCWKPGWAGAREVYFGPARPLSEVGPALRCSVWSGDAEGGQRGDLAVPPGREPGFGDDRTPLSKLNLDRRKVSLELGIAPIPDERTAALEGNDAESTDLLRAMGYLVPDQAEHAESGCVPPRVAP